MSSGFAGPGSRRTPGLGMAGALLYLSISRSIVEAHGGRLWAEAGPGGKFRFTLPTGNPEHE